MQQNTDAHTSYLETIPPALRDYVQDEESAAQYQKGQRLLQHILTRSATDRTFRQQLLEDPQAAVTAAFGDEVRDVYGEESIPLNIQFIENTADVTYVLPDAVDTEAELSEEDLEVVAGGATPVAGAAAAAIVSNMACLGFAAGVATVAVIAWVAN